MNANKTTPTPTQTVEALAVESTSTLEPAATEAPAITEAPAATLTQTRPAATKAPLSPTPSPLPPGWSTYVVQEGDTLVGIAFRFGLPVEAIVETNQLGDAPIYVGQVLLIPAAPKLTPPPDGGLRIAKEDDMPLVFVPAGEFLMGSATDDARADEDEKPQHAVYLDAYWIDQTEVTNAMFARFVAATGYQTDAERQGGGWLWTAANRGEFLAGANWQHPHGPSTTIAGLENHPVVQVSWHDAAVYCAWAGRRLPTSAEWEKGARGPNGQTHPWGEAPPAGHLANLADRNLNYPWAEGALDDGHAYTAPVGSYPAGASPYGALDMAGNVYEWVADWYGRDYYSVSPPANPLGPTTGQVREVRGGAWASAGNFLRSAYRNWKEPDRPHDIYGFRCALTP